MAVDETAINASRTTNNIEKDNSADPTKFTSYRTRQGKTIHDAALSGIAGGIAGCVAKTSVAPLDRVKILFQAGHPDYARYAGTFTGVFRASAHIFHETGVRGLLQGHSATLARIFPYAGIKFMAYEYFHQLLMPTRAQENALRLFTAGAGSGVISVLVTYPLDLIRVRLAIETRLSPSDAIPGPLQMVRKIWTEPSRSGIRNLYAGFLPSLLGMVPYAGVSFVTYGLLRNNLRSSNKRSSFFDLVTGCISGACAQTASYPFEVVRRRMQKGGGQPMLDTVVYVWRTYGWRGFYVGLSVGYVKVVPMTGVSYATWEAMKRVLGVRR